MTILHTYRSELKFSRFIYEGKKVQQDCINGLMLLFAKSEQVHLINLNCNSAVLYKPVQKSIVKKVDFDNCILNHPDIEPNMRILPTSKDVSFSLKQSSRLIKMEGLTKLELH